MSNNLEQAVRSNMASAKFGLMDRVVAGLYNDFCVFTCVHEVKNVIEKIVGDAWMTVLAQYLLLIGKSVRKKYQGHYTRNKSFILFQLPADVIFAMLCFKRCVACATKICTRMTWKSMSNKDQSHNTGSSVLYSMYAHWTFITNMAYN